MVSASPSFLVQDGMQSIDSVRADGSGEREVLLKPGAVSMGSPSDWSPDGAVLAFVIRSVGNTATMLDIMTLRPFDESSPDGLSARPVVETPLDDRNAKISPDGRWIAYESGMFGGQGEVYVQPFPGPGGRVQVSNGGGRDPRWSPKGGELFYRNGNAVLAVSYAAAGNAFQHDATRELFRGNFSTQSSTYDVFPDGEHFVMLQPADDGSVAPTEGVVILNWFEELERLVPTE